MDGSTFTEWLVAIIAVIMALAITPFIIRMIFQEMAERKAEKKNKVRFDALMTAEPTPEDLVAQFADYPLHQIPPDIISKISQT